MPIEIREINIKTEINSGGKPGAVSLTSKEIESIRKQLLDECKQIIALSSKKNGTKR
jgi:hypothetical protein